jgi:Flp pilus assembly protein TadG
MMRKLDQRGVAALEFCLVAVPLFILMFAIFDLGRYAITMQSLRMLANAGARAMMIKCYTPAVTANTSPSGCTDINTYFPDPQRQNAAPFLHGAGLTPKLTITLYTPPATATPTALTVTAELERLADGTPGFTMIMPIWPTAFNAPSASTSIPF